MKMPAGADDVGVEIRIERRRRAEAVGKIGGLHVAALHELMQRRPGPPFASFGSTRSVLR